VEGTVVVSATLKQNVAGKRSYYQVQEMEVKENRYMCKVGKGREKESKIEN
jgi:hypothetical protein